LTIALVLTCAFVVVEAVGAVAFHSLALAADAAHMFSDAAALVIALIAQRLAQRPASQSHTFGWRRAEVLAAQANGVLLIAVSLWIVAEAINRIGDPPDVRPGGMIAVATAGLVVNVISTIVLHRAPGENINVTAAAMHTLSDAAASVGAILAGVIIALGGSNVADPILSIVIAALVMVAAGSLLSDATRVLLEAAPRGCDPSAIEAALVAQPDVVAVHHLHVWSLASDVPALSVHVELQGPMSLHDAQARADSMKAILSEQFAIDHATLELECHPCDPADAAHG
jgi:cobalt-zinc-cadmium efflux system protein